jgi:hypothetical protein
VSASLKFREREKRPCISNDIVDNAIAMARNTGAVAKPDSDFDARYQKLQAQTRSIAERLADQGIELRLPVTALAIGEVSGQCDDVESYKACRILPLIAQRDRRPMLNALTYYLEAHAGSHVRFAVVTSGTPVEIGGDLRARQTAFTTRLREWAAEAEEQYGVEVLFRGIEYTIKPDRGVHLHANILYRLHNHLDKLQWAAFLSFSRLFLGLVWKECGEIYDVREVVKYQCKPAELERIDGPGLAWLYHQTRHTRHMTPLGAFKTWFAGVREARQKFVWVSTGEGAAKLLHRVVKASRSSELDEDEVHTPGGLGFGPKENILLARCLPQPRFTDKYEPVTMVEGFTLNPVTVGGKLRLDKICRRLIQANEWARDNENRTSANLSISVHTGSLIFPDLAAAAATVASGAKMKGRASGLIVGPDNNCVINAETGRVIYRKYEVEDDKN